MTMIHYNKMKNNPIVVRIPNRIRCRMLRKAGYKRVK